MTVRQGSNIIAGIGTNSINNAHTLLDFKWSDHKLYDVSWLRADTFSWQSGQVYSTAYQHLVADLSGATAGSETIAGITIEYVTATDGHKICPASQETAVEQIYQATGVAWYYIVDTTNQRFKLPRRIHREIVETYTSEKNGYRIWSDGYCEQWGRGNTSNSIVSITLHKVMRDLNYTVTAGNNTSATYGSPTACNIISTSQFQLRCGATTEWMWKASGYLAEGQYPKNSLQDYKYLYFYVGEYSRSAVEQTAGLNAELFNQKADKSEVWTPTSSTSAQKETIVGWGMPSEEYINITTNPYTAPADGYVYLQTNITKHGSVILQNETTGIKTYEHGSYEISVNGYGYIPVRKGDVVSYANNTGYGYSVTVFRFHFAEGEK